MPIGVFFTSPAASESSVTLDKRLLSALPPSRPGVEHRTYITNQCPRSFVLLPQIEEPDCTAGLVRRLTLTTKTFKVLANQANCEPAFNGETMNSNRHVAKVFVVRRVKDSG